MISKNNSSGLSLTAVIFIVFLILKLTENIDWSSIVSRHQGYNDLSFFWKDDFKFNIVNNDYMGPNVNAVYEYFRGLNNE